MLEKALFRDCPALGRARRSRARSRPDGWRQSGRRHRSRHARCCLPCVVGEHPSGVPIGPDLVGHWCRQNSIEPIDAGPELVARWIRALAGIDADKGKGRAMATIERYLVHVGRAYRIAGLVDPTSAQRVRLELKATRHALRVRQRQAHPIRPQGGRRACLSSRDHGDDHPVARGG